MSINFTFYWWPCAISLGNLSQIETLVLNVSGRILMVNKENNGSASENLVSALSLCFVYFFAQQIVLMCNVQHTNRLEFI